MLMMANIFKAYGFVDKYVLVKSTHTYQPEPCGTCGKADG
jgi:hypothetical protein